MSRYRMGEAEREIGIARITAKAVPGLPSERRTIAATTTTEVTSSRRLEPTEERIGPTVSLPKRTR